MELDIHKKNFTSDWLLEYPQEFYDERESFKSDFKINFQEHPNLDEYTMLDTNVIPFFLGNGIDLPKNWEVLLSPHQLNFYIKLLRKEQEIITKPFLYLAILSHVIDRLPLNNISNYRPYDYLKLIYYD